MTLAQIAGWLTVGFLFWLLLLTHDAVAAPNALAQAPASVTITTANDHHTSFRFFNRRKPALRRTEAAARHAGQGNADFWQAREANRRALTIRPTLLGLLVPARIRRQPRARYQQAAPTYFQRTHGKFGRRGKLGPALGTIFQRNSGR